MVTKNTLIKAADFSQFDYSILLRNTTSNSEVHDSTKLRIVELEEKGMKLLMPTTSCTKEHLLTLYIFPNKSVMKVGAIPKDKDVEKYGFIITGKVTAVEMTQKMGIQICDISFIQYTEFTWKQFCSKFKSMQKEVDRIFKVVKE